MTDLDRDFHHHLVLQSNMDVYPFAFFYFLIFFKRLDSNYGFCKAKIIIL